MGQQRESSWLLGLDWETPLCQMDSILNFLRMLKFLVRLAKNRHKLQIK
jgi:hypothetical protein